MKRSITVTAGLALAGLLGLLDVASLPFTDGEHPPMVIAAADALLGVITLVGVVLAWRGNRGGIVAVIVSRLLSVLAGIGVAVTLLSVLLIAPALRDGRSAAVLS
jgi:hypothetical protein